jgi:hypothetical protein
MVVSSSRRHQCHEVWLGASSDPDTAEATEQRRQLPAEVVAGKGLPKGNSRETARFGL